MPIPEDVKPFLEGFTAEETKLFDNLLTKSPKLAEGWLRQSDYDRKMNERKAEMEKATKRSTELEDWYTENKPIHDRALARSRELEDQQKELQEKLTAAGAARTAAGGDQVDAAELSRRVQEEFAKLKDQYGFVSRAEQDKIIAEQTQKLAGDETKKLIDDARKSYYEEMMPAGVNLAADVAEICVDHKNEFNERLDRKKFAEYMAERKFTDPVKAYEEYVKPRRDEVAFKQKVEDEVKQRMSGIAISGGTIQPGGGVMPKGAMQMKIEKDAAANGAAVTSVLAAQAAAELRSEGKM